jgi:hypothetical protein
MTNYSELLDAGRMKRGRFAQRQVQECLRIARRDVETARAVIDYSPEWAFNIAYNAMHQGGRGFLKEAQEAITAAQEFVAEIERRLEEGGQ